jgi:hypothetical protein
VLLDGVCRFDSDLVIGLVPVFNAKVKVFQINVNKRTDEFVLDKMPDDPYLIAVYFTIGF